MDLGSPLARRHLMTGVTLVVLLALLVVGAYAGYKALFAPLPSDADDQGSASSTCEKGLRKGETVRTRNVAISVYNAGSRSGLAQRTQQQLLDRGFIAGDLDNAPADQRVRFVRILAPRTSDPAARLVARQFARGTAVVATKADLGPGVDIIVGDRFVGLAKGAPRSLKATASGSGC